MKPCRWIVLSLACLAGAGCRVDPNIRILERELRLQEDHIYQLEQCIDDYGDVLESCRRENAALKNCLAARDTSEEPAISPRPSSSRSSPRPKPPQAPADALPAPPVTAPGTEVPGLPERLKVPARPSAGEGSPGHERRAGPARPHDSTPPELTGPLLPGLPAVEATPQRRIGGGEPMIPGDSTQVTRIELHRLVTGGYNTSRRPGHDGILVVIEPRDAEGRLLEAAADVSVVVLDPALEGQAARVARWEFTAEEIASRFSKTGLARGIELQMPWPAEPPAHGDLHLFVRYSTGDGRKLQAERPIKIALPGDPPRNGSPPGPPVQAEPRGPALRAYRGPEPWRQAPPSAAATTDTPPLRAASRPVEPPVRTADLPARTARRPNDWPPRPEPPKLQRPVWSPERP